MRYRDYRIWRGRAFLLLFNKTVGGFGEEQDEDEAPNTLPLLRCSSLYTVCYCLTSFGSGSRMKRTTVCSLLHPKSSQVKVFASPKHCDAALIHIVV